MGGGAGQRGGGRGNASHCVTYPNYRPSFDAFWTMDQHTITEGCDGPVHHHLGPWKHLELTLFPWNTVCPCRGSVLARGVPDWILDPVTIYSTFI